MSSNTNYILSIVAAALTSITGNSLLRLGLKKAGIESLNLAYLVKNLLSVIFQPVVFLGFVIFGISAVIWMRVLTMESLNKSYPILVGLMMILLTISSTIVLKEVPSVTRIAGMVLIVLGAFLVFAKA